MTGLAEISRDHTRHASSKTNENKTLNPEKWFLIYFFSKYETEENDLIISLSNIAILENSPFNGNIEFVETDWNIFLWN